LTSQGSLVRSQSPTIFLLIPRPDRIGSCQPAGRLVLGGIWPQADTRPRGFLALLILLLPVTALVVLYTPPFEAWRQARAEQLIDDAIDLETTVSAPVRVGFGLEPTITVSDIQGRGRPAEGHGRDLGQDSEP